MQNSVGAGMISRFNFGFWLPQNFPKLLFIEQQNNLKDFMSDKKE